MRVTDLLEAEGRTLRAVVRKEGQSLRTASSKLALALAVLAVLAPLAIIGLALLFLSLYLGVEGQWGQPAAAAITGVVTLVVCGGLLWIFKLLTA